MRLDEAVVQLGEAARPFEKSKRRRKHHNILIFLTIQTMYLELLIHLLISLHALQKLFAPAWVVCRKAAR